MPSLKNKPVADTLYTIGHSTHSMGLFLDLLKAHDISALADVRSVPWSGRYPQFQQTALKEALKAAGIAYVFLGDQLGGKPKSADLNTADGRPDYRLIAAGEGFKQGVERLRDGMDRYSVALMCAEKDPLTCHRFGLVCRNIRGHLPISHILSDGSLETQDAAEARLVKEEKVTTLPLLGEGEAEALEQAYRSRFGS